MNKKIKLIMTIILLFSLVLTTGFTNINNEPHTVYRVYLKGESLGIIKSKKSLENYIDSKQEQIKRKYNVSKVYVPTDLDIVKETTFSNELKTNKQIYDAIKDSSPFTIDGYIVKIRGTETKKNGQVEKTKSQIIYVLKKSVFTNSIERTVKSFISNEDYENYANGTQKEIEDTGKIIEALYIKNKITIKKAKIPVDKQIYESEEDLSKYLLFGTTEDQAKYIIKDGDTISDVAFNNKISVEEFLVANPDLQDENSLLSPGQEVTLGILKPQFSLVEEDHVVKREQKQYTTETRYDNNQLVGYEKVLQQGVAGENKVTQKIQKENGETVNAVTTATEVIKEPINEIVVKGGKKNSYSEYYGGGYGTVVATRGQWGWPASCSSVSSPFDN